MGNNSRRQKTLCLIGVFCLFYAGLFGIFGCSSEDLVSDLVDVDVEAAADFELPTVTVEKEAPVAQRGALETEENCGTANIQELYASVEFEGKDQIDIQSILLEYVWVKYIATWEPDTITSFNCTLTLKSVGEGDPTVVEVVETVVNNSTPGGTAWAAITPSTEATNFINTYLASPTLDFNYCVSCDDAAGDVESYNVQYDVNIGVNIKGNI